MKVKATSDSPQLEKHYALNVINTHICRHINIYVETDSPGGKEKEVLGEARTPALQAGELSSALLSLCISPWGRLCLTQRGREELHTLHQQKGGERGPRRLGWLLHQRAVRPGAWECGLSFQPQAGGVAVCLRAFPVAKPLHPGRSNHREEVCLSSRAAGWDPSCRASGERLLQLQLWLGSGKWKGMQFAGCKG